MPDKRHHRSKPMAYAKTAMDDLTELAPFLEPIEDNHFRGRNSGTVRQAWLDCMAFYRDYYKLGGPPWMHSRRSGMNIKLNMLRDKAFKRGWREFTLE